MNPSTASFDAAARKRLERWLAAHLPGAESVRVGEPERFAGGYSAETLMFDADIRTAEGERRERFVLRKETPEPSVYPRQAPGLDVEVEIQFRAMHALARHTRVPLAGLLGFERDPKCLGSPFYVMGFVPGLVPAVSPPYAQVGFFAEAQPAQRRALLEDGLRVLAEIHAADWLEAGLDWLVAPGARPGIAQQLALWEDYGRRELRGRAHPLFDEGLAWLHARLPRDEELVFSWGDARPGNMIWRDFRCVCVTDFENAAIAPPELDLGWWLMFDRWSHEVFGVPRLPGELTRAEQLAHYERCSGRRLRDVRYFEVFAALRYTAIVVRVMNRTEARGEVPHDPQYWRDNLSSTCLAQLLAAGPDLG